MNCGRRIAFSINVFEVPLECDQPIPQITESIWLTNSRNEYYTCNNHKTHKHMLTSSPSMPIKNHNDKIQKKHAKKKSIVKK